MKRANFGYSTAIRRTATSILGVAITALCLSSSLVVAQEYPFKPVKVVVPWPAGGQVDVMTRVVAQRLAERLKQPVIVENRPGANGIVGASATANSHADGYTLFTSTLETVSINPAVYTNLPYNPAADFAPVMMLIQYGYVLTARANLPVNSVREAVALVKAAPGKFTYGTWGIGSLNHLSTEMLSRSEALSMLHVPFSTGPISTLLAGQVDFVVMPAGLSDSFRKAGKFKVLAIGTEKRNALMPDVPTLKEQGFNLEIVNHVGWMAPAKTPASVINRLYAEVSAVLKMKDVQDALASQASEVAILSPQEYGKYVQIQTELWKDAAQKSNARLEFK